MDRSDVVVLGAGVAGARVVRRLRENGFAGTVTLVDEQSYLPYDRPPLSKAVLRAKPVLPALIDEFTMRSWAINWLPGRRGRSLSAQQLLYLDDGSCIEFGALVIATGAVARRVPGRYGNTLRTYDDAIALRRRTGRDKTAAIVGAGLVGSEVAASLRETGTQVHLIDPMRTPMSRVLGDLMGSHVKDVHYRRGVVLHMECHVARAVAGRLHLSDGTELTVDVILEAIGAVPDLRWLSGSGITVDNGIVCNQAQQTAVPNIYTAGDAAAPEGHRSEHWSAAIHQADRVVAAILGTPPPPRRTPVLVE